VSVWLRAARLPLAVWRGLAWLGWRLGLRGWGRRYAVADDQLRMLRGTLPRYTVEPFDQAGELTTSLFVGAATPAERRALGLPTREEQLRDVEAENRRRAEWRYEQEGLPEGLNLARVWAPLSAAEIESRWRAEGVGVWRDGGDLTFVHRAEVAELHIVPAIQLPMWRLDGDLWVLRVRVRDLDRAAISYAFVSPGEPWPGAETWRGPLAPPGPRRAAPLEGELLQQDLQSRWLAGSRGLTVYLPPGREAPQLVVFMADGQSVRGFAEVVEPLVLDGTIPRAALVGVHCAEPAGGDDLRMREYIPGHDRARFEAHRRFFMEEVPAWAVRELGLPVEPSHQAVAGFSNGAVLVSALGCGYPDRVGRVIAFSVGVEPPLPRSSRPAAHYLLAGTLEPGFSETTRRLAERLRSRGVTVELRERVCGHDSLMWEEELPAAINWAFS
jgi:enterochelin esterase-like enzyme